MNRQKTHVTRQMVLNLDRALNDPQTSPDAASCRKFGERLDVNVLSWVNIRNIHLFIWYFWRLAKQFEERTVGKRYLSIVHGCPEPAADLIDAPLGPHPRQRLLQSVRHDEQGKSAISIYRTLEQYAQHALIEVELKTGRTHQIRVHLSHVGHPLLGDDLYGGKRCVPSELGPGPDDLDLSLPVVDRQALHATNLSIHHPISEKPMNFTATPPQDLHQAVTRLRRGGCKVLTPAGAELSSALFA